MLTRKYDHLRNRIQNLGSALVAYSGGVDSTLLAFITHVVLGERCLAVLAISDMHIDNEIEDARQTARELGLHLHEVDTHELTDPRFRMNPVDRCYYCKSEMFGLLRTVASARGIKWVLDGSNADDASDHRPGGRAAREYGVVSPLLEVGLHKDEIRSLSHELGLPNWNKPSMACLATRFPYGTPITEEGIARVGVAEKGIRDLGIRQFRVRAHGDVARVEVEPEEMQRAWELRDAVSAAIKTAGFTFAAQDLEGYRTGSMNDALSGEDLARETSGDEFT
ncbi:MAG: ATP-dependent sacrificial sulfur transferase LarE [Coriobacteriia bacterium]|nr:ATP-dependent sacrificial sulfur transferase LarE [Coriobacteriia bacterium]